MTMSKEEVAKLMTEVEIYDTRWSKERREAEAERRKAPRIPADFDVGDRVHTVGYLPAHEHDEGEVMWTGPYRSWIVWSRGDMHWAQNDEVAKGKRPKAAADVINLVLALIMELDGVTGDIRKVQENKG